MTTPRPETIGGVPVAVLSALIDKGRESGELHADDIARALEDIELTPKLIDELVGRLQNEGVRVEDDVHSHGPGDVDEWGAGSPVGFPGAIADPVRAYLQTIGSIPLLRPEQERRLAELMAAGNQATEVIEQRVGDQAIDSEEIERLQHLVAKGLEARKRLVEANLRLVVSVAKRYRHRGLSFLDLIQEGNAGLMRAVEKFDYTRGFKLSTYATWWIRQAMSRAVADQARSIRIPVHVFEALNRVLRVQRSMLQEHGTEPSIDELAARVQMPVERVREILSVDRSTVSLEPIGDETGLGDLLPDAKIEMPADAVNRHALADTLRTALLGLSEREQELMRQRFGLSDGRPRSLEEVGRSFGVTRERIRQIETKTLAKLRAPLARSEIEEFLRD